MVDKKSIFIIMIELLRQTKNEQYLSE